MEDNTSKNPFERILNFRDVAASTNSFSNKHTLQPGLFFRSGLPDEATPADRERLVTKYRMKSIIDLRTDSEHVQQTRKTAKKIPASPIAEPADPAKPLRIPGIKYYDVNVNGRGYSGALIKQLSYWNVAKLATLYTIGYRNEAISVLGENVMAKRGLIGLAEDSLTHSPSEIKSALDILSDRSNYPLLVHCTQGKDRTGLIVLLVLLLLEVPLDAISRDYQMSEKELASEREARLVQIRSIGLPDDFAGCAPKWAESVTDWIQGRYGGVSPYLERCGVSKDQQDRVKAILTYHPVGNAT